MNQNVIDIKIIAKDLASSTLKSIGQSAKSFGTNFSNQMKKGAQQLTILTGVLTGVGVAAMKSFANSAVDAAAEFEKAMITLDIIAPRFGISADKAKQSAIELGKSLRIGPTAAAESLQNLFKAGLGLEEASDLLKRFANEAMTGKSESIDLSTAVQNLSFAYTTNNSALGNLSGVSENFSDIIERGAKLMGKQTKDMSEAELEMAKYKGMIELTNLTLGSASKFQGTYIDKQAILAMKLQEVRVELGQKLMPIYAKVQQVFIDLLNKIDINKLWEQMSSVLKTLRPVLQQIGDVLKTVFKAVFPNNKTFKDFSIVLGIVTIAVVALTAAVFVLTSPLVAIGAVIALVSLGFVKFRDQIKPVIDLITGVAVNAFNDFRLIFEKIRPILEIVGNIIMTNLKMAFDGLINSFQMILPELKELWISFEPIAKVLAVIGGVIIGVVLVALSALINIIANLAGPILKFMIDQLTAVFNVMVGGAKIVISIGQTIGDFINKIINSFVYLKNSAANIFNGIKNIISSRINEVKGFFNSLGDTVSNVVNKVKGFFSDIKGLGGSITSAIKSFINSNVIDRFNGIEIEVLGKSIGLPNIPRLAKGGDFVTSGPQIVMVGDNPGGKERVQVTPLSSPNVNGPKGGGNVTFNNYFSSDVSSESIASRLLFQMQTV